MRYCEPQLGKVAIERERDHGCKTNCSNENVAQEKTNGTTIHEGSCCSEEETGTDDTTNTKRRKVS